MAAVNPGSFVPLLMEITHSRFVWYAIGVYTGGKVWNAKRKLSFPFFLNEKLCEVFVLFRTARGSSFGQERRS